MMMNSNSNNGISLVYLIVWTVCMYLRFLSRRLLVFVSSREGEVGCLILVEEKREHTRSASEQLDMQSVLLRGSNGMHWRCFRY
jgi:hypothetical protein